MKTRLELFMEKAKAMGCKVRDITRDGKSSAIIGVCPKPKKGSKSTKKSAS